MALSNNWLSLLAACISTSDTRRASSQEGDLHVSSNWQLPSCASKMCAVFRNKILSSSPERQPRVTGVAYPRLGVSFTLWPKEISHGKKKVFFFFLLTVVVDYACDICGDYYHLKLFSSFKCECLYKNICISMLANKLFIVLINQNVSWWLFQTSLVLFIIPLFPCVLLSLFPS